MRQIDGTKENLTKINEPVGHNHEKREMKVTIFSSIPKQSNEGKTQLKRKISPNNNIW